MFTVPHLGPHIQISAMFDAMTEAKGNEKANSFIT